MSRERKGNRHRKIGLYAAGASALAALILTAVFAPWLVFRLQDSLRCRDYTFSVQEGQDITLLSTSYEKSLYRRMLQFAEDKQSGIEMYVTSQEMTPNQELEDFLQSDSGLYQDGVLLWADINAISYDLIYDCQPTKWKQYVIYTDNYARGINFIIWYVELENKAGMIYKLLLDAQTGAVYGIHSDNAFFREQTKTESVEELNLGEMLGFSLMTETDREDAWIALAYYYGGYDENPEFLSVIEDQMNYVYSDKDGYLEETYVVNGNIVWKLEYVIRGSTDGEEWLDFIFPYGETSQTFRLDLNGDILYAGKQNTYVFDITIGFPDIYELIPEFQN